MTRILHQTTVVYITRADFQGPVMEIHGGSARSPDPVKPRDVRSRSGSVVGLKGRSAQGSKRSGSERSQKSPSKPKAASAPGQLSHRRRVVCSSLILPELGDDLLDGAQAELLRDIEELRSENEYLKDEIDGLRSEMQEVRDAFQEEGQCQLQELRGQLDRAHRTCRVLQYRLRKAERRSLRVARSGQVDGELVRSLEQDIKVARSTSVRLHTQLTSTEEKRVALEQENQELRVRLQNLEVAQQVLQAENSKAKGSSLRRRGSRCSAKPERKCSQQDDVADLKCQLHFANEESLLMCKKLTKMAKENESMRDELSRYRSLYGDLDPPALPAGVDSQASRDGEVRAHLRLVEEEANLLSRRVVELEVENRGLRAEMEEMRTDGAEPELTNSGRSQIAEEEADLPAEEERIGRLIGGWSQCRSEGGASEVGMASADQGLALGDYSGSMPHKGLKGSECDAPTPSYRTFLPRARRKLHALWDQACLVSSTINLLAKQVADPTSLLSTQLDALQVLLAGFLQENQTPVCPESEQVEGRPWFAYKQKQLTSSDQSETEVKGREDVPNSEREEETCEASVHLDTAEHTDSESGQLRQTLLPLILRLRCFTKQWHRARAADGDPKESSQICCLKERCLLLEELHQRPTPKQGSGAGSALLELQKELRGLSTAFYLQLREILELTGQFTQARRCWEAERTHLKGIIAQLGASSGKTVLVEKMELLGVNLLHLKEENSEKCPMDILPKDSSSAERKEDEADPQSGPIVRTWPYRPIFNKWDLPNTSTLGVKHRSIRQSHTAPDKSSLRLYYSPPRVRRAGPQPGEEQPGACPQEATPTSTGTSEVKPESWLVGMMANLSDDMKQMTFGMRRDAASQTGRVGLVGVSVGLQTEPPRASRIPSERQRSRLGLRGLGHRGHGGPGLDTEVGKATQRPGLVQEFLRSVCGRGPTSIPLKAAVGERSPPPLTSPHHPAKTDRVTRIVNRRFMKQHPEAGATVERDSAYDCTSQSLTSCFTRPCGPDRGNQHIKSRLPGAPTNEEGGNRGAQTTNTDSS